MTEVTRDGYTVNMAAVAEHGSSDAQLPAAPGPTQGSSASAPAQLPKAPNSGGVSYPANMLRDLAKSGLVPADMRARPLTPAEKAACQIPMSGDGYVIPYFSPQGAPIQFYRIKLFDADYSYKQVNNTPNHIYFPQGLQALLTSSPFLLWVEGEKKAAACVKAGIPAVAVGGVDSWRNRILVLPKDMKLAHTKQGQIAAKVPSGAMVGESVDTVATGYTELVDYLTRTQKTLIICYDSDGTDEHPVKNEVQRAVAVLGWDLRFRGIPSRQIRQCILPRRLGSSGDGLRGSGDEVSGSHGLTTTPKVGVDDFLVANGSKALRALIDGTLAERSAFPRHPNPKDYVNKRLQRTHLSRQEAQSLGMAILSDLDAKGQRLKAASDQSTYYFDLKSKKLIRANFDMRQAFYESVFGIKLYTDYNLSAVDQRLLGWLGAQFNAEEPIQQVTPERVLTVRGDVGYYQLNDGQTIRVSAQEVKVIDNGDDEVLFEAGLTTGGDSTKFKEAVHYQRNLPQFQNEWYSVLQDARLATVEGDKVRKLLSYLYYISPWLYKWRGSQLPVEITTGEPGSGKSTLYQLRLDILTGLPNLRNAPSDMRDWGSSLAGTGGLHVTDNVQLLDQNLRQKLSDEICRLVTEPNPAIEQRKLYTDNTVIRTPVRCVFAITAVRQPFTNVDIIQRSIITELDKGTDADLVYDDTWEAQKLALLGGREGWLAHHCEFLRRFFTLVETDWNPRYKGKYRLTNVEQMLQLCAKVFGEDGSWIPEYLAGDRDRRMSESDWALEGIREFIEQKRVAFGAHVYKQKFTCGDISEWAVEEEDFKQCQILQSSRSLGRYLSSHKHVVASTCAFVPAGKVANRETYRVKDPKERS